LSQIQARISYAGVRTRDVLVYGADDRYQETFGGELVAGAFGTPQTWIDEVFAAGARAGERYWQLPLIEEYRADMESWTGDLVNFSRNNEGGLVKSALFIQEFVTKPWVHLDIAGTAYFRKVLPFAARGSTGVSHATLVELALAGAKA